MPILIRSCISQVIWINGNLMVFRPGKVIIKNNQKSDELKKERLVYYERVL